MDRSGPVSLDIIIPLYNEEAMIEPLSTELSKIFSPEALSQRNIKRIRFVMVDDGCADRTAEIVSAKISAGFPAILIRLSRNFGHQNALCAGLDRTDADLTAVIDADLQDPPELILQMIDRWREGFEVVYAQRRKRQASVFKRFAYWSFYRLVAMLADVSIPLDSGDFCLMDRRVVEALRSLPENLRFIRGLRAWVGFRQTGLAYDRPARRAGETKYSLKKLYKLATDGIASFSIRPLKVAQVLAFSYFVFSVVLGAVLLIPWLSGKDSPVPPLMMITYLLIVSGNAAVCLCIYILGAYVGRGYLETKHRPLYIIREVLPYSHPPANPAQQQTAEVDR